VRPKQKASEQDQTQRLIDCIHLGGKQLALSLDDIHLLCQISSLRLRDVAELRLNPLKGVDTAQDRPLRFEAIGRKRALLGPNQLSILRNVRHNREAGPNSLVLR